MQKKIGLVGLALAVFGVFSVLVSTLGLEQLYYLSSVVFYAFASYVAYTTFVTERRLEKKRDNYDSAEQVFVYLHESPYSESIDGIVSDFQREVLTLSLIHISEPTRPY